MPPKLRSEDTDEPAESMVTDSNESHKKSKKSKKSKKDESDVTPPATEEKAASEVAEEIEQEKSKKKKSKKSKHLHEGADENNAAATSSSSPSADDANSQFEKIRLFNPASPRHDRMILHYINTIDQCHTAVAILQKESCISVDCEGVALSRTGELCLIQVSTALHQETDIFHVYLFDVVALGKAAFTTGLGALLSAPTPTKLFYDVRRDSESLYHQYGILLKGVCDIQLLEIARRRLRNENVNYLPGLARLLSDRFTDLDVDLQRIKDGMSGKYNEEPDLWRKRPLSKEQTIYAAIDVVLLHVLLEEITSPPTPASIAAKKLAAEKKKAAQSTTDASEDTEMKDAAADETTIESAMKKLNGPNSTTTTTATTITTKTESSSSTSSTGRIHKSQIYVNEQTRTIIEQYSDVVWAASIRDTDSEPDMWSRRHVPLAFHHATFPLSLQAACTQILNSQVDANLAGEDASEKNSKSKSNKRKAPSSSEDVKIDANFTVTTAQPAEPQKSLSHFVQRVAKTPLARNNYSGVAGTLKHLRSQQEKTATKEAEKKGRPSQSSTSTASSTTTSTSATSLLPASLQAGHSTTAAFVDHAAFHPQITKELLKQHQKLAAKQHPSKKPKVEATF